MHEENIKPDEMIHVLDDFNSLGGADPVENDVDVGDGIGGEPNNFVQHYDELFSEIEAELYLSCPKFSSLNFLIKLMDLKVCISGLISILTLC